MQCAYYNIIMLYHERYYIILYYEEHYIFILKNTLTNYANLNSYIQATKCSIICTTHYQLWHEDFFFFNAEI